MVTGQKSMEMGQPFHISQGVQDTSNEVWDCRVNSIEIRGLGKESSMKILEQGMTWIHYQS